MIVKRILLVDDDDDIRQVAGMSLELVGGWAVSTASSGAQALELAAAEQPDAIILDVMMPDLDGPQTFRRLQADDTTRSIPVVLLTAKVQAADRARFDELGVCGVLTKPFDPMKLSDEVSDVLGWS